MKNRKQKSDEFDGEENYNSFSDFDIDKESDIVEEISDDTEDEFEIISFGKKAGRFLDESFLNNFDNKGNTFLRERNGQIILTRPNEKEERIVSIYDMMNTPSYRKFIIFSIDQDYTILPKFYTNQNQRYELNNDHLEDLISVLIGNPFSKEKYLKKILSFFNEKDSSTNKTERITSYYNRDGEKKTENDLNTVCDDTEDIVNKIETNQEFENKDDIFWDDKILNIERICHIKEKDESLPESLKPFEKHLRILNISAIKSMATSADLKLNYYYNKEYKEII